MKATIHRVLSTHSNAAQLSVDEIDISNDAVLLERYGLEIPVLLIDGRKVAKYRVTEGELTRMIEGRKGA